MSMPQKRNKTNKQKTVHWFFKKLNKKKKKNWKIDSVDDDEDDDDASLELSYRF